MTKQDRSTVLFIGIVVFILAGILVALFSTKSAQQDADAFRQNQPAAASSSR